MVHALARSPKVPFVASSFRIVSEVFNAIANARWQLLNDDDANLKNDWTIIAVQFTTTIERDETSIAAQTIDCDKENAMKNLPPSQDLLLIFSALWNKTRTR